MSCKLGELVELPIRRRVWEREWYEIIVQRGGPLQSPGY